MSGIFQNIDPSPPAGVYPPPLLQGEDTLAGWRWGGGSIFWKTPDTDLYSTYVSKYFVLSRSPISCGSPLVRVRLQDVYAVTISSGTGTADGTSPLPPPPPRSSR
jgi:hypothetical protein